MASAPPRLPTQVWGAGSSPIGEDSRLRFAEKRIVLFQTACMHNVSGGTVTRTETKSRCFGSNLNAAFVGGKKGRNSRVFPGCESVGNAHNTGGAEQPRRFCPIGLGRMPLPIETQGIAAWFGDGVLISMTRLGSARDARGG